MKLLKSLVVAAGTSTLLACASQAPTASSATGTRHDSALPTAVAGQKKDNRLIPEGYRRVVVNGDERFCRTDPEPGSRVQKHTVCLTRNELDAEQDRSRDLMNNLSRQSGTNTGSRGNMGNMPMGGPY
ncbi:MAG TPA: hypothetical protein VGI35_08735 [Steroidobacteraceae bacterium]